MICFQKSTIDAKSKMGCVLLICLPVAGIEGCSLKVIRTAMTVLDNAFDLVIAI